MSLYYMLKYGKHHRTPNREILLTARAEESTVSSYSSFFLFPFLDVPSRSRWGNETIDTITARLIAKLAEKAPKEFRRQAEEGRLLRQRGRG